MSTPAPSTPAPSTPALSTSAPSTSAQHGTGVSVAAEELIALRNQVMPAATKDAVSALPGGFAIARRGNGQVIADSRIYIHGDDLRHVDRGATARTGALHIRRFHEERDRVTFLIADFRPSMLWGIRHALRSVTVAHALAILGWQAVDAGGRVGLLAITGDDRFWVTSRPRVCGMLAVIGGLVRAHAHAIETASATPDDPDLGQALAGLEPVIPRGADIVIATALDRLGADFEANLGRLARQCRPRFLVIEDSALEQLQTGTYPLRRSDGSRSRVLYRKRGDGGATGFERSGLDKSGLEILDGYRVDHVDASRPVFETEAG